MKKVIDANMFCLFVRNLFALKIWHIFLAALADNLSKTFKKVSRLTEKFQEVPMQKCVKKNKHFCRCWCCTGEEEEKLSIIKNFPKYPGIQKSDWKYFPWCWSCCCTAVHWWENKVYSWKVLRKKTKKMTLFCCCCCCYCCCWWCTGERKLEADKRFLKPTDGWQNLICDICVIHRKRTYDGFDIQ